MLIIRSFVCRDYVGLDRFHCISLMLSDELSYTAEIEL